MLDDVQSQCSGSVCPSPPWEGVGYAGVASQPSQLPVRGYGCRRAGATCSACFHTHGGYGPLAPSARSWWASPGLHLSGPYESRLSYRYAVSVRLITGSFPAGTDNSFRDYGQLQLCCRLFLCRRILYPDLLSSFSAFALSGFLLVCSNTMRNTQTTVFTV